MKQSRMVDLFVRSAVCFVVAVSLEVLGRPFAMAQQVKEPVVGTLKSGNAMLTSGGQTGTTAFRAAIPASAVSSGVFVVTQVCYFMNIGSFMSLTDSLGKLNVGLYIAPSVSDRTVSRAAGCTNFSPGLVVPPGDLGCSSDAEQFTCAVTGVLTNPPK